MNKTHYHETDFCRVCGAPQLGVHYHESNEEDE